MSRATAVRPLAVSRSASTTSTSTVCRPRSSVASCSRRSTRRATTVTAWPRSAKRRANSAPIPLDAPVTSTGMDAGTAPAVAMLHLRDVLVKLERVDERVRSPAAEPLLTSARDAVGLRADPRVPRHCSWVCRRRAGGQQRAGTAPPLGCKGTPVRVRHRAPRIRATPVFGELLRHRNAVHHLRRRIDLPVPLGHNRAPVEDLRRHRDRHLHRHVAGGAAVHLAQGSPAMGLTGDNAIANPWVLQAQDAGTIALPRVGAGERAAVQSGGVTTTIEQVIQWGRYSSLWPALFGLACCAIEMMAVGASRYDMARFGAEVFRASPRQAGVMIVAGRVSQKMAPVLRQIYDQMPEPKWVISMGACASSGGMFNNYAIVQGVDKVVPVDVYIPGCPPRPEGLLDAVMKLQKKIAGELPGSLLG